MELTNTKQLDNIQRVRLKKDNKIYYIYAIYNPIELSLCIKGYKDTEQDFTIFIHEIKLLKKDIK